MKVIVAGTRTITSRNAVIDAINNSGFTITRLISGYCPDGVDAIGEQWAEVNGIPISRFAADWKTHGASAGPIRNRAMARYADALILVWDGCSRGSSSMKYEARKAGIPIHEVIIAAPPAQQEAERG